MSATHDHAWSLHQAGGCMSSISANKHNVGKKGVSIVLLIGALPVPLHNVRSQKLGRMAVGGQNMDYGSHMIEKHTIEATLLRQATPHPWRVIHFSAENSQSFGRCCHNVFGAAACHALAAQSSTAKLQRCAATTETN